MNPTSHLSAALDALPRAALAHLPTPFEPMPNLGARLGRALHVKRDDCTGLALGGNKARQLEYYLGAARAAAADTVLITGAVQSNFVRMAAAAARKCGMDIHIQLEQRVSHMPADYYASGNVLLDRLLGATIHSFPVGEDEAGADANLERLAVELRETGKRPYVIHLGATHPPLGALGYARAAVEIAEQIEANGSGIEQIVVASGSAHTHSGLLFGLRAIGCRIPVTGICVRRAASLQAPRVLECTDAIARLLRAANPVTEADVRLYDGALAPGYGRFGEAVHEALRHTAECEGILLDPVYTGKAMAGLMALVRADSLGSGPVLFVHTGGAPALFGYREALAL